MICGINDPGREGQSFVKQFLLPEEVGEPQAGVAAERMTTSITFRLLNQLERSGFRLITQDCLDVEIAADLNGTTPGVRQLRSDPMGWPGLHTKAKTKEPVRKEKLVSSPGKQ